LTLVFVVNVTASPVIPSGRDIPDYITNLDQLAEYWKEDLSSLLVSDPNQTPEMAAHGSNDFFSGEGRINKLTVC